MSRVHELGRLDRSRLISEWLRTHPRAEPAMARSVAEHASNEQLIDQIIAAEQTQRPAASATAAGRRSEANL